jgi:hypothetical protein
MPLRRRWWSPHEVLIIVGAALAVGAAIGLTVAVNVR